MKKENALTLAIVAALVAGVLFGQFVLHDPAKTAEALRSATGVYQSAGEIIFIQPLRLMVVPLVFLSVVLGVTSIGNPAKLGVVGGATMLYFVSTTLIAVVLGIAIATAVGPGEGVNLSAFESAEQQYQQDVSKKVESGPAGVGAAFASIARSMIPSNIIQAAAETNVLALVVFAIALGVALSFGGRASETTISALDGLLAAMMRIVGWIMWLAPVGVFLIIAARVGQSGLANLLGPLSKYILCVVGGLFLHMTVVLPVVLWVFGRTNPYRFMWQMKKVILTAFSTASSSATLPVTIEECATVGGCSKRAATFVPALGSTVNMNGTALYEAVAVLFLFQAFGIDLTMGQQLVILVTATLAAVGAPGIPGAGLVTMAIVINAVNSSLLAMGPDAKQLPLWTIGIIIGVDRFLDMCRTVLNVFGDCVGAKIMTRLAPDEADGKQPAYA